MKKDHFGSFLFFIFTHANLAAAICLLVLVASQYSTANLRRVFEVARSFSLPKSHSMLAWLAYAGAPLFHRYLWLHCSPYTTYTRWSSWFCHLLSVEQRGQWLAQLTWPCRVSLD